MPDDHERPSLEAPQLFGRRRARKAPPEPGPEDAATEVVPVEAATPAEPADEPVAATAPAEAPGGGRRARRTTGSSAGTGETTVVLDEPVADEPAARRERRERRERPRREGPLLPGRPAALLTGLVVGLALVGLTWLGSRGCEVVRGTSSCGPAPGMAALLVVLALAIVVGGVLLRLFRVPDPGATSFLATGLTGVICLLFLVDDLDHWSMVLVIPAITAGTFLFSWWVTTTYVDSD